MKKTVKYFLLVGVLAVGAAFYNINNATAHQMDMTPYRYQHYQAVPAQAMQADLMTAAQGNSNQNPDSSQNQNNNQPPYPAYPPYMQGPGMMWNNPYYGPNSNGQQPPAYNYTPYGMGMGMMGWCW